MCSSPLSVSPSDLLRRAPSRLLGPARAALWLLGFMLAPGIWVPAAAQEEVPRSSRDQNDGVLSLEDRIRYFYALGKQDEMGEAIEKLRQVDPDNRVLAFYARHLESGQIARASQKRYYEFLLAATTDTAASEQAPAAPGVPPSESATAAPDSAPPAVAETTEAPAPSALESSPPPPPAPQEKGFLGSLFERAKDMPIAYIVGGVGLLALLFVLRGALKKRAGKTPGAEPGRAAHAAEPVAPTAAERPADETIPTEFSFAGETDDSFFTPGGETATERLGRPTAGPLQPDTATESDEAFMSAEEAPEAAPSSGPEEVAEARPVFAEAVDEPPPQPLELESLVLDSIEEDEDSRSAGDQPMTAYEHVLDQATEDEGEPRVDFGDFFARMGRKESGEPEPPSVESPELSSQVFADRFHGVFLPPEEKGIGEGQTDTAPPSDEIDLDLVRREAGLFDPFSTADETVPETEATVFGSADQTQIQSDLDESFFHSLEQTRAQGAFAATEDDRRAPAPVNLEEEETEILGAIDIPMLAAEAEPDSEGVVEEETLVLDDPDAVARLGLLPALGDDMSSDERGQLFDESFRRGCRAFEQQDYHAALEQFRLAQSMHPDDAEVANRLALVQKALRNADTAG